MSDVLEKLQNFVEFNRLFNSGPIESHEEVGGDEV